MDPERAAGHRARWPPAPEGRSPIPARVRRRPVARAARTGQRRWPVEAAGYVRSARRIPMPPARVSAGHPTGRTATAPTDGAIPDPPARPRDPTRAGHAPSVERQLAYIPIQNKAIVRLCYQHARKTPAYPQGELDESPSACHHPGRRRRQAHEVGAAEGAAADCRAADARPCHRVGAGAGAGRHPRGVRTWRRSGAGGVRRSTGPAMGAPGAAVGYRSCRGPGHAAGARCRQRAGAVRRRAADPRRDAAAPAGRTGRVAVLVAEPEDPSGYGRVVRDAEAGSPRSSSTRTPATNSAASAPSTPASSPPNPPRCAAGCRRCPTTTCRASTT